jgi:mono/diheme cytochrome c family protein
VKPAGGKIVSKNEIEIQSSGAPGAGFHSIPAIPITLCAVALFSLALCVGCTAGRASTRDDVPEEIARRKNPVTLEETELRYYKRQFKGKCARCHGQDGAGGDDAPAPNTVAPANFTDAEYMATRTDGQLFYQILMGGGDRCAMPAFGPESDHAWTEEKIWHMVAYVRRYAQGSAKGVATSR